MAVRVSLIADEPTGCDHCHKNTGTVLFAFKFTEPANNIRCQLWLHKDCLTELIEKLWMLEAKQVATKGMKLIKGKHETY
jgi:hypothetical protein